MGWRRLTTVVLLAACGTQPTEPVTPGGTWTLVSVDGAVLPAQVTTHVAVVAGSLELKSDGTYREVTQSLTATASLRSEITGTWRFRDGTVELLDRQAGLPFVARWAGSRLDVSGDRVMRYSR